MHTDSFQPSVLGGVGQGGSSVEDPLDRAGEVVEGKTDPRCFHGAKDPLKSTSEPTHALLDAGVPGEVSWGGGHFGRSAPQFWVSTFPNDQHLRRSISISTKPFPTWTSLPLGSSAWSGSCTRVCTMPFAAVDECSCPYPLLSDLAPPST